MQGSTAISANTSVSSSSVTAKDQILGKDDFLKLLLTQLKNQDPLKPMESYEFSAQLAQFSSLEQLSNIKDILSSSLESNKTLTETIYNTLATNLIGKEVKVNVSKLKFDGINSVKFGFEGTSEALSATVTIMDSSGKVIKTYENISLQDENNFSWDGKDNNGNIVPVGEYLIKVEAKDSVNNTIKISPFTIGKISAIRYKSGETYLVINGSEINIKDLEEIIGGDTNAGS
jgi:flagellar basal-body rod modification protein FlgD